MHAPARMSQRRQPAPPHRRDPLHHPEQGWNLLCNGTIVFDDTGELLPDGSVVAPQRTLGHALAA